MKENNIILDHDVVSKIIMDANSLDVLMFHLRIENGVPVKDICDITGFSNEVVNKRLGKLFNQIKNETRKQ